MDVSILLALVVAICTFFYTIINLMLWFESRALRSQKTTPFLVAYLRETDSHVSLVLHIRNIGEGYAKNVRLKLAEEFYQFGDKKFPLSACGAFRSWFNSVPPGYELQYFLGNSHVINKEGEYSVRLSIAYESVSGKRYLNDYDLPFNQLQGQNYSQPKRTWGEYPITSMPLMKI